MKKLLAPAAIAAVLLASCASDKVLSDSEYIAKANEAMKQGVYDLAIGDYQKLLEEYPFSDYSEEAQLKIGQAQYQNQQYAEAIASFQDFQRMHPTNPNLALTEYYTALAYMDQMGKADRDQRAAENAQVHFQTVIERYPDSPFTAEAKQKLKQTREELAGHELDVARFYLIWTNPIGAEARLRRLLENFPDTDVSGNALMTFGRYFKKRGDLSRSALAYASALSQYPGNDKLDEARTALAEFKDKQIEIPSAPLPALVETLGRPTMVAAPAAPAAAKPGDKPADAPAEKKTDVSDAQTHPDPSARN